jgi:hypothetical protein
LFTRLFFFETLPSKPLIWQSLIYRNKMKKVKDRLIISAGTL